jgi:hypothetical protein
VSYEEESDSSALDDVKTVWIVDKIMETFRNNEHLIFREGQDWSEGKKHKLKALFDELMDFVEADQYFQSILIDVIDESFNKDLKAYLIQ